MKCWLLVQANNPLLLTKYVCTITVLSLMATYLTAQYNVVNQLNSLLAA